MIRVFCSLSRRPVSERGRSARLAALLGVALLWGGLTLLGGGVTLLATPAHADPSLLSDHCERPVRFGYLPGRAPYQDTTPDGHADGLDIRAGGAALDAIGCQVEYVPVGWPRGWTQLERGVIDMLAGASYSEDRSAVAIFSAPYRREVYALYVRRGLVGAYPLAGLSDIVASGFRLALNDDALYGPAVSALLEDPGFRRQVTMVKGEEQPELLSIGRVDGYLLDINVADAYNSKVPVTDRLDRHPAVTIDNGPIHFMFSRATVPQQMVDRINAALVKGGEALGEQGRAVPYAWVR